MFLHMSNVFVTKLFHTWTRPIPNTSPQAFAWLSPPHPWSPRPGIIQWCAHKQINPSVPAATCTCLYYYTFPCTVPILLVYLFYSTSNFRSIIFLFDASAPCTWRRDLGGNRTGILNIYWGPTEKAEQPWQQTTIKAMEFPNEIKQPYIIKNNHTKPLHDFGEQEKTNRPSNHVWHTQKQGSTQPCENKVQEQNIPFFQLRWLSLHH